MTKIREVEVSWLYFPRVFTTEGVDPGKEIRWVKRNAEILGKDGLPVFRQENVEVPDFWSELATAIVFDKYAYGKIGTSERETSVRQIVGRVVDHIVFAGKLRGYFSSESAVVFQNELTYLLLNQYACFNSPVWFNVGCRRGTGYSWDFELDDVARCSLINESRYQVSACFIVSTKDEIGIVDDPDGVGTITRNVAVETNIFKYGSGAGSNRSRIRSSREPVTGGGRASGPVSFMRIYDSVGSVTKSGGISRRAAKMEILNCDHPDIMEFVQSKHKEELKAKALIAAGYESDFNGEAYNTVLFQNSNLSVRVTDAFMDAVVDDLPWQTLSVVTGKPESVDGTLMPEYKAREIMDAVAEGTWHCGDPGLQFDDTIQKWHTTPNAGRNYSTNPCSEYISNDDSACNLASLNLMKFRREDGSFEVDRFKAAVRVMTVAMDILVDLGSYPTPEIARNAHRFRQLGLGYTNLGGFLMSSGLPYDSEEGRYLAAAITSMMTATVYRTSSEIASLLGAFDGFAADRDTMMMVIDQHRSAAFCSFKSQPSGSRFDWGEVIREWDWAIYGGRHLGFRNAQATVLAPTGTISFMMDCATTGIEPAIALVSYKNLWGRGQLKLVNDHVGEGLRSLGYKNEQIQRIVEYIDKNDTIEGAPGLDLGHLSVFDCAFPPASGTQKRSISWMGHLKMVAAVQPALSGSSSKTINMPKESTVDDIRNTYLEAWKLGLKCVAIYRDGSKDSQPVSTKKVGGKGKVEDLPVVLQERPKRERLPDLRKSLTHKASVGGVEFYITVGLYPDGRPGEVFCVIAKQGSTVGGLMDAWSTMVSLALQYGVPPRVIAEKFSGGRFEPSGITQNPDIPFAASLIDYIARWIGVTFVPGYLEGRQIGRNGEAGLPVPRGPVLAHAPVCSFCGGLCQPAGSCWVCSSCGMSQGGCS